MAEQHIAVVGAGPGGLTAALILAARGFDVTVFEKADRVGGRNAPIHLGEFTFDTGPTFLMLKFILDEVFHEAGRRSEDYMDLVRLEPMYQLIFDDFGMLVTTDREEMKRQIREHFPGREEGLDEFMEREGKRFKYLFPCLQKHYSHWTTFFSPVLLKALPHLSLGSSVMDQVTDYFGEEKLGICFSFQSKYLGMSPWDCPAAFTMLSYIEHAYGIYHVMGGLSEISASMARLAGELGVEIRLNTPVARVATVDGAASGVELEDGELVEADKVIINADFGYAMSELVEPGLLKKWHPDKLREKPFSCSTYMMYLGLDKTYDMPHHNIVFAGDYRKNLEQVFETKVLPDDMSFYVRNASLTDDRLAPGGQSAVYVLVPVPNNKSGINWEAEEPAYRKKVLTQIAERTDMTDIADHIVAEKTLTPRDWEDQYNVFLGATFNLAHNIPHMMYFRPRNRFEEVENLYLVGGGTHPGSGMPTILESGRITANLICDRYDVPYQPPAGLARIAEEVD
jgi:phytoene desaturase